MAASVNAISLLGHAGRDVEVRSFANGGRVATFSVATSDRWKSKDTGEWKERTAWHQIAILDDRLIDYATKNIRKGVRCFVSGQMEYREWTTQDGQKRVAAEVTLRPYKGASIVPLDARQNGGQQESGVGWTDNAGIDPQAAGSDLDDEIPW